MGIIKGLCYIGLVIQHWTLPLLFWGPFPLGRVLMENQALGNQDKWAHVTWAWPLGATSKGFSSWSRDAEMKRWSEFIHNRSCPQMQWPSHAAPGAVVSWLYGSCRKTVVLPISWSSESLGSCTFSKPVLPVSCRFCDQPHTNVLLVNFIFSVFL